MIRQSGHFDYDENLDAFYDYEKYGMERMNAEDGMFTDRGYIAYKGYLTAYDLDVQRQNMARDKPLVGRVTYANGDAQEFTDAEAFLQCAREELPYRPTTGFRYEVLTDDPSVRKQVDDMIFDFYGEEAPCRQEDHEPRPEQGMTFGGM